MQQLQRRVLVLGIIGFIMAPIQWTASQVVKGASSVETGALRVWQWCDSRRESRRRDREAQTEYNLRFKYKKSMGESSDERQ